MSMDAMWPWIALLFLGALHGLNPGMGWLFAVALGVQRGARREVWRALLPMAAGHALAVTVAVLLASVVGLVVPIDQLPWLVAGAMILLGVRQIVRHRHPRWSRAGMRIRGRELVIWSFLVATAHGAGLMAVPFAAEAGAVAAPTTAYAEAAPREALAHGAHGTHTMTVGRTAHQTGHGAQRLSGGVLGATVIHTLGYLGTTGILALLVYHFAGLRLLRRAWVNIDLLWAGVLVLTGIALMLT